MFQLHCFPIIFKICHQETPRKLGRFGIEWEKYLVVHADCDSIFADNVNATKSSEFLLQFNRKFGQEVQ